MTTRTQLPAPLIYALRLVTGACLPVIGFGAWCLVVARREGRR